MKSFSFLTSTISRCTCTQFYLTYVHMYVITVYKQYNMSTRALDEPNIKEIKTLMKLNKTIKDLFLEATYKLDIDFILNITFIYYGKEGEKRDQKELHLGKDTFQVGNLI